MICQGPAARGILRSRFSAESSLPEKGWQEDVCQLSRGRSRPRGQVRAVSPGVGWLLPRPACLPPSCPHFPVAGTPWLWGQYLWVQVLGKANGASERLNCQVLFWGEKACEILVGIVARRPVAFSFSNHQNP